MKNSKIQTHFKIKFLLKKRAYRNDQFNLSQNKRGQQTKIYNLQYKQLIKNEGYIIQKRYLQSLIIEYYQQQCQTTQKKERKKYIEESLKKRLNQLINVSQQNKIKIQYKIRQNYFIIIEQGR
ncbi:hypothetical protein TTHERM_000361561 (macronuclear) [Tetrahymena thermophila SB210]|uniref:Uncharacterized protein n=1 Tax=Tetrahymena thermophila (strain SB210) TaxID=312017 RepID=W7XFD5_TETTS|nr:hypothetical protein TTHERM_000361561 [Tetrahymena thermophila SB210]EWS76537.1 hypothetical protein TTHERM_000361561 [Tetrahymena thermophila SB210]|eukprot:XP_012650909.1 hypothetical protein TTHERM_000361561 [Tetrahymena thermophila SB210]